MADNQRYSNASDQDDYEKHECPPVPEPPAPFKIPPDPGVDYFKKLPKDKKESIKANRKKREDEASVAKETAISAAAEERDSQKANFDKAEKRYQSDKKILDKVTITHKETLRQAYRANLATKLPKNCKPLDDVDIEDDDRIPDDQKAIAIATFIDALAAEDVSYRAALKALSDKKQDATNAWNKAQSTYADAICKAEEDERKKRAESDLQWRNEISQALAEICK